MSQYRNWHNEGNSRDQSNRALRLMLSSVTPYSPPSRTGSDQRVPEINLRPHQETPNIVPTTNDHSSGVFPPRESNASLGMNACNSSSSSATQGFPARLFGSNLLLHHRSAEINSVTPSNDRFTLDTQHSAREHVGNNNYSSQNMSSLGSSLLPHGPEYNQSGNSFSSLNAINSSGVQGYEVEEQDGRDDTRRLPFKRRSPENHSFREYEIGESSSTGGQAGNLRRRVAPFQDNNANNDNVINISTLSENNNGINSGHFDAGIGHDVSNVQVQHFNEARRTHNFPRFYANLHAAATNPQAFLPPHMRSESHVPLPTQQQQPHPFLGHAEAPSVDAMFSAHPIEDVPYFLEAQQTPPWSWTNNNMRPRNAHSASLPIYSATGGSEAMTPVYNQRNNNFMLGPHFGMGSWPHNGNIDFFAGFQHPDSSQYRSENIIQPPNTRAWVQSSVSVQQYVRISPVGTVRRFVAPSISTTTGQASSDPSPSYTSAGSSQQNVPIGLGDSRFIYENQHELVARSENRAHGNLTSTSPDLRIDRMRLRDEIRRALRHLRNGGAMRVEDLMILDYSIVLNLLDAQEDLDELNPSSENWPYEMLVALEEQMGNVETGLSEEEILTHIGHEIFQSNTEEETNPQHETCTICQEDYVDGEQIGRLDCGHIFHLACIKTWLMLKNVCPICKQTALALVEEED